jgi:hypothetical protein
MAEEGELKGNGLEEGDGRSVGGNVGSSMHAKCPGQEGHACRCSPTIVVLKGLGDKCSTDSEEESD